MALQLEHMLFMLLMLSLSPAATLQCNCVDDKCLADGSCEKGYQCKRGFFGYFCEYHDYIQHDKHSVSESRYHVTVSSCLPYVTGEKVIKYKEHSDLKDLKVYMVRIIVDDNSKYRNISFVFKDDQANEQSCEGHLLLLETTILEYYCGRLILSRELAIRNKGRINICFVHITEGRNMLQNGLITTKMKSYNASFNDKNGLIDGNRENSKGSCFLTENSKNYEMIQFVMSAPAFVNNVQVFGHEGLGYESIIGASVMLLDTNRRFRQSFETDAINTKKYYGVFGSAIRAVNLMKKGRFGACEVEAIGDCTNGTFGHDCRSTCKSRCKDSRCTSKEICIGCKDGLIGQRCCKPFCDPVKDCGDDGDCINGCMVKKYGIDCTKDCSPNCGGNGSCGVEGTCISGCKVGYYEHNCSYECSPNCGGRGDCNINGSCTSGCKTGYFGHDCTKYPIGCNCVDFKCLSDGSCQNGYKCKNKYFGYFCEYSDISEHGNYSVLELTDEDLTTCAAINGDLVIPYTRTRIYMIRLIVEDSSKYRNISVVFREDEADEHSCEGHLLLLETTILEYYCGRLILSHKLIIRGIDGNRLCHVYVTEGRNMILNAGLQTEQGNVSYDSFYDMEGLIDGDRRYVKGSCYLPHRFVATKYIALYLKAPAMLNFAQIFWNSGRANAPFKIDAGFMVRDAKPKIYQLFHVYNQSVKQYIKDDVKSVVKFAIIYYHPFGLCEIELIGDCAYGTFGHDCNSSCSQNCNEARCTSKGICIGCKHGLVGRRCCKPFCDPVKVCGDDGNCINGCVKKKYGIDCTQDCSPYCAEDGSCNIDGVCTFGCQTGFFGPQCLQLGLSSQMAGQETMTCHCSGDKCRNPSDQCKDFENCILGWFGYDCAYKDISVPATISDTSLNDNNLDTCLPDDDYHASVEWKTTIMFSFVVLTFKEGADISNFIVITKTGDSKNTFMEDQIRSKVIRSHVFQIDLMMRVQLNELAISWSGTGSLCSMSVSGDRNLAIELAMSPEVKENPALKEMITPLTDGVVSGQNCIVTNQKLVIRFPFENFVFISSVVIFPDVTNKDEAVIKVTWKSSITNTSRNVNILGNRYSTVMLQSDDKVNAIDIELIEGSVDICEIEIFGECSPSHYGLSCKDQCPAKCSQGECDYNGQCLQTDFISFHKSQSAAERLHSIARTYYSIIFLIVRMSII